MTNEQEMINEIANELHALSSSAWVAWEECEGGYLDVRLQLHDSGSWEIHEGDSQYDTDHRGSWGYSSITEDMDLSECEDVARDLVDQALEMQAQRA